MMKLSFRVQVSMIVITVAIVVAATVVVVINNIEKTREANRIALRNSDAGIDKFLGNISERAMDIDEETGIPMIIIDSVNNFLQFSEQSETDGGFSVTATKDTVAADTIRIRIESRGYFDRATFSQTSEIFLFSPDSVNWFPESR